ncbi:non-ribosomal peptide synthetase [Streptomyces lonarensis]|uniref:non-ribosomal peptide synthetase n=1 Tax=Streptomyces lonarensis TaxID=700599 RepID=UPI0028B04280|nr:non-ribosomal peptide synthetase [Streptomyces lonarensis]
MNDVPAPDRVRPGESEVLAAVAAALGIPPEELAPEADPFDLGIDSLALIRLTAAWRRQGVAVGYEELAEAATLRDWVSVLAQAPAAPATQSDHAAALVPAEEPARARPEEPAEDTDAFPLAAMQHAYWIGRQDDQPLGGVGAHFYVELDGSGVDPDRLATAVTALRRRHDMLRVTVLDDGRQHTRAAPAQPAVTVHDLTARTAAERERELIRLRDHGTHRRMDPEQGEVFDVALTLLPAGRTRLHLDLDMVGADAASMRVLLADLRHLYEQPEVPLPEPGTTYRDYLRETRERRRDDVASARQWWRGRLDGLSAPPRLPIVADPLDPAARDPHHHRTVRHHHHLSAERKQLLLDHARRHRLTPTAVLATAFAETLAAWSAEPRFLLNLPLFHRDLAHPGTELLVGDFSSSVLLDIDLTRPQPFADTARTVQAELRRTIARGAYSGVDVLRDLSRASGGAPVLAPVVYTSALGMGEVYDRPVRETFGEPSWIISQGPQVWLDAQVTELDDGILLNWDVRENLFAPGVPAAAFDAYRSLVEGLLDDEHAWTRPVGSRLPAEQAAVRDRANATDTVVAPRLLHEGFHRAADAQPRAVAVIDETGHPHSYGELRDRAGRVTALLLASGVRPGDSVAVRLPRGVGQVAAVLGVLGAGGCYVPVGTHQPADRATRVLRAAKVTAELTDGPAAVPVDGSHRVLSLAEADVHAPAAPLLDHPGTATAYTIYTSGSTGVPKGVDVSHGAAMNTLTALNDRFAVGAEDRGLALAELDFDMAVYDLFGPLSAGGSVVLVDEAAHRDPQHWARLIREHGVTLVNCVPALLDMTLTAAEADPAGIGGSLRLVLLGGDRVGPDLFGRLRALVPAARFVALGGMTEAAVHSTVHEVDHALPDGVPVPWGVPLPNMRARVVDARGRDCPDWVPGELWLSGAGLADGYRDDPERTARAFVHHAGRRWYRTGDRARYHGDGTLEFLGRVDHQVKLRGHRIELGEVEAAVTGRPDVSGAVALLTAGPVQLALVVGGVPDTPPPAVDALREELTRTLPGYMVPTRIEVVPLLPLTANGKPDRRRAAQLLAASAPAPAVTHQPPVGWAETTLAEVWSQLLGAASVGRDDDFFTLGGDSLLATRTIAALRERGAGGARVARLFALPRLADFAATLTRGENREQSLGAGDTARRHEPFPPTDVQRAFWIGRDDRLPLGGVGTYHYSEFDGADVDLSRVEHAWQLLVARHEMLRAVFDDEGRQRILPDVPRHTIAVTEVDPGTDPTAALDALRHESSHRRLDPTHWPLFDLRAVRYHRDGQTRTRLAVGLDYLVLDGASIMALYAELDALHTDPAAQLPPVDISFRDYVLDVVPERAAVERARAYWLRRLDDLPPAPELPLAGDPGAVTRPRFTRRDRPLAADRWQAIRDRARTEGLTPSVILLLCYVEVLAAWSDQDGVTVNLTLFNRLPVHPHIDRLVGDFTSVSLIGHRPRPGESWLKAAHRLQSVMGEDLDHREASAIWLMQELARRTGTVEAAMPVVFSSTVGVGDRATKDLSGSFPAKVFGITQTPQVMLDNQVTESAGGIMVSWDAVEELFRPGVLDAMFDAYCRMLHRLADEPWSDGPLPAVLPPRHPAAGEPAAADRPTAVPLHLDVLRHAGTDPERAALITSEGSTVGYGELAHRVSLITGGLLRHGVRPGDTVALRLPVGVDQVTAVLGILGAGAACLPLPYASEEAVEPPSGVGLVVTDLPSGSPSGPAHLRPDELTHGADPAPPLAPDADAPAWVRLTPDGPLVFGHAAVADALAELRDLLALSSDDRGLALSPPDTAGAVLDLFGLLGSGASLILPNAAEQDDPAAAALLGARHRATVWNGTPLQLDRLLAHSGADPAVRIAALSGSRVGHDLPARLRARFGPAFRTVTLAPVPGTPLWGLAHEPPATQPDGRVPATAGRPLGGVRYRVADPAGRDRPDWVSGELWLAWPAHGTPQGAPPERLTTTDGTRWYRTGTRARHRPDGTLELRAVHGPLPSAGRAVDPADVETLLESHPAVDHAVLVATGPAADPRIHAVVVPGGVRTAELAGHLEAHLPAHAVPSRITSLDSPDHLPATPGGEIDRAALTDLLNADQDTGGPPRTPTESRVAELWARLLATAPPDRDTNFFAAGGDSLTALRLVGAANEEFGTDIPVRAFLAAATPAELAARINDMQTDHTADEESGEI